MVVPTGRDSAPYQVREGTAMSDGQKRNEDDVAEITVSLKHRASELWGIERADALAPVIEETAQRIWRISQDPPPDEEEPGFYS